MTNLEAIEWSLVTGDVGPDLCFITFLRIAQSLFYEHTALYKTTNRVKKEKLNHALHKVKLNP